MNLSRTRTSTLALALIFLPATIGVLAIHASPTCQKFLTTHVITQPVRNRVSKATATAWAIWRGEHPTWKPNPNVHRPKYKMTVKEAMAKIEFACQVDEPKPVTTEITLDQPDILLPTVPLPEMTVPEVTAPVTPDVEVATTTTEDQPLPPFTVFTAESFPVLTAPLPPTAPSVPLAPTPEPSSIILVGSGLAMAMQLARKRK